MRAVIGLGALAWLAVAVACGTADITPAPVPSRVDAAEEAPSETSTDASTGDGGLRDGSASKDGSSFDAPSSFDGGGYAAIEGLSGPAFRTALKTLISGHTSLGYDGARDVMLGVTGNFDLTGGMLECVYTGKKAAPDGTRTPNGFNTEHTWPQSLGAGSEPARSDLHHLFPVDELANNARGNLPFAATSCTSACAYDNGGSRKGPLLGGVEEVFEVRPVRRGDVARALFYFAVRYDQSIEAFEETALRSWHDSDAPDAVEQARNDAIETYQKNRNPFVDRPDFVAKIADY